MSEVEAQVGDTVLVEGTVQCRGTGNLVIRFPWIDLLDREVGYTEVQVTPNAIRQVIASVAAPWEEAGLWEQRERDEASGMYDEVGVA